MLRIVVFWNKVESLLGGNQYNTKKKKNKKKKKFCKDCEFYPVCLWVLKTTDQAIFTPFVYVLLSDQ